MVENTFPGSDVSAADESLPPSAPEPAPVEEGISGEPVREEPATDPFAPAEETPAEAPFPAMGGASSRPPAPFPPAAALLNLTGLGLGYLYLRRWVRWAVHLALTVLLVVAAYLTNAASLPWLWLGVGGAWLVWMVVDGWLQAARRRRAAPEQPAGRWWLPTAIGWVAVALVAGGVGAYLSFGQREFDAGMAAYRSGDCRQAIHTMNWVTSFYELTLSPNVAAADRTIVECNLLVYAENQWQNAAYEEAIVGYETYLDNYPSGGLVPLAREQVAQVSLDWCGALRREGAYETAIATYQALLQRYPHTAAARDVDLLTAEAYAEWALAFQEEGQYDEAIARYDLILDRYPGTPTGREAPALAAEVYVLWAGELEAAGQYEEAIVKYRTVLAEYPDTPMGRQSANLAAAAYESWAAQLRQAGQYEEAIARYQVVQDEFPAAPVDTYALAAETYWTWAGQLRQDNDYETALAKYEVINNNYASAYPPNEVRLTMAETYDEWAAYLREQDLYGLALTKYETLQNTYADTPPGQQAPAAILEMHWEWANALWTSQGYSSAIGKFTYIIENYPDTPEAITATVNIGRVYNDWGESLSLDHSFTEAMGKHRLAKEATDDPEVAAAAEAGYNGALDGLARDTTGEGKKLLDQVLDSACEGEGNDSPALNLFTDEPGKAAYDGDLFSLPDDLLATMPGHLRYVICSTKGTSVIERCSYSGGHTLIRQRLWWRIRVRSPRTGNILYDKTFWGDYPGTCPFMYTFYGSDAYKSGGSPSHDAVIEWLRGIVY